MLSQVEEVVMRTPDYDKLLEYGLDQRVAEKLDEIYKVKLNSILYSNFLPLVSFQVIFKFRSLSL